MCRSRRRYAQRVYTVLAVVLAIAVSNAPAQTLENATIAKGGGVLADGSIVIIGQPLVGTISNADFTIEVGIIRRNALPVAVCAPLTAEVDQNCCVNFKVSDIDGGSFDPDGLGDVDSICITAAGHSLGNGCETSVQLCDDGTLNPHTVTLTITDRFGESASCDATVTLFDATLPSIICPPDMDVVCSGRGFTVATYPDPTVTDNCDPVPSLSCTPASGTGFLNAATTTVTCVAMDRSTNVDECTFDVTVGGLLLLLATEDQLGVGPTPGSKQTVRRGPRLTRASTTPPRVGLSIGVYDQGIGSCARDVCGELSPNWHACIVANCNPVADDVTDRGGGARFVLPQGDYLAIGGDGTDRRLTVAIGRRELCLIRTSGQER